MIYFNSYFKTLKYKTNKFVMQRSDRNNDKSLKS